MTEIRELLDLPRGAPLRVMLKDCSIEDATFHHIDGSYSYCTLDNRRSDPDPKGETKAVVFHLYIFQKLELVEGRWEPCE